MRPLNFLTLLRLALEAVNEFILNLHEHVSAQEDDK